MAECSKHIWVSNGLNDAVCMRCGASLKGSENA